MNLVDIHQALVSEIKLTNDEARVFLLVVMKGKMTDKKIAEKLNIETNKILHICKNLEKLGGFIELSKNEYESMHPRFTSVNMYRRMCERENLEFKRNKIVDNIGVVLEKPYDLARTKH